MRVRCAIYVVLFWMVIAAFTCFVMWSKDYVPWWAWPWMVVAVIFCGTSRVLFAIFVAVEKARTISKLNSPTTPEAEQ